MNPSPVKESLPDKLWCETCEGTGTVYQEHQAGCHVGGDFPCPDCDGKGYWTRKAQAIAAPREGWQPIASVPKDGTPVLLRGKFKGVEVCAWNKHDSVYPWALLDGAMDSGTNSRVDGYATHWASIHIPAAPLAVEATPRKETP